MRAARAGKVIPSSSIMPGRLTPYYLGAALLSTTAGAAEFTQRGSFTPKSRPAAWLAS